MIPVFHVSVTPSNTSFAEYEIQFALLNEVRQPRLQFFRLGLRPRRASSSSPSSLREFQQTGRQGMLPLEPPSV